MKKDNREKSQKDYLILVLILYSVLGILLLKYYRYQINPDGVNYISIAQKYLAGNFRDAVNGYWGPLFSWLLMPFLFLKVEPLLATKILNLIIGLLIIIVMRSLSHQFSLTVWTRRVILFSLIPIVFSFSISACTPDLLLTCLLLVYFRIIFQPDYPGTIKQGVLCGLWGGIAYLAKAYALPFFISHFLLMNILHYLRHDSREKKNKILINCFCGFVVFSIISSMWIAVISAKYHRLTYSTVPRVAMYQKSPGYRAINKHPTGFISPPNSTAISITEDSFFWNHPHWSPFDSPDALRHHIKTTMKHAIQILYNFQLFSRLSIVICLTYVLFLLQRPRKILTQWKVVYPFVSLLLFCAGYSLIHVQDRYLWVTCFLLLLMGGYMVDKLFQNNFFTKIRKTALYVFFIASFAYMPIVSNLPARLNKHKFIYLLSQKFKNHIRPGDRIASNTTGDRIASNTEWSLTLYLAYHLDARYYSTARANISEQDLEDELRKFNIHHYLVWGEPVESHLSLSGYQQVDIDGIIEPKLYSLVTRD